MGNNNAKNTDKVAEFCAILEKYNCDWDVIRNNLIEKYEERELCERFSNTIKKIREELGLSQEQMGKLLDCTKQNISKIEMNKQKILCSATKLQHIAKSTNVPISYLLGINEDKKEKVGDIKVELEELTEEERKKKESEIEKDKRGYGFSKMELYFLQYPTSEYQDCDKNDERLQQYNIKPIYPFLTKNIDPEDLIDGIVQKLKEDNKLCSDLYNILYFSSDDDRKKFKKIAHIFTDF